MRSVLQAPDWPTGKENLSAASTVSNVLRERLAIKLVMNLLHNTSSCFYPLLHALSFNILSSILSLPLPGSPHCDHCPSEFWSNADRTACVPRQMDFLSFNETLGITLTTAAVSGATVTAAVFLVFVYYHQTPMVRITQGLLFGFSPFFPP